MGSSNSEPCKNNWREIVFHKPGTRLRKAFFGAALLLSAALCYLCLTPHYCISAYLPGKFSLVPFLKYNAFYHFFGYFMLSLLVILSLSGGMGLRCGLALLVSMILGGAIELLQSHVPCHGASWVDFGLDVVGSLLAISVCLFYTRKYRTVNEDGVDTVIQRLQQPPSPSREVH